MVTAIEEITLNQGLDPREAVTVGGGGGAGLYAATIARRLGSERVVIPAVSAALSAAGALLSELSRDFQRIQLSSSRAFDPAAANATLDALVADCDAFRAGAGRDAVASEVRLSVEARYPNQVWEVEVPLPVQRFAGEEDVAALEQAFHRAHEELFAFSDGDSGIEIVSWHAHVSCRLHEAADVTIAAPAAAPEESRTRPAYFSGHGTGATAVHRIEQLASGATVAGPAIVESPVTTVVVPPGAALRRLDSGSLLLLTGAAATPVLTPALAETEQPR
ncbi:MAG TPA: hydantoinase/oxoprolinase family protein, partial [Conexibacter sp.]|nr:hydantoinase/oxoprolinase family protein [Conexibacter sp.]